MSAGKITSGKRRKPNLEKTELATHFETYRTHKLASGSPQTIYQYRLNLRRYGEFLGHEPTLDDLRDERVAAAQNWLMREKKLSAGSVSKFHDDLCALWRFLARKGVVSHWPDVAAVIEPKRVPIAWSRDQLVKLWAFLERMPGELDGVPASDWFCSLHATIWDTGERIGALLNTEWKDVDLAEGWIVVRAETRKGRLSDHLSRLHPSTVDWLKRVRNPDRQFVWPWPYNRPYLWVVYGQILKGAGLPCDRKRKFHCLRKSVASHLVAANGNAQLAMGHSTPQMTQEVYVDPRIAGQEFPADRLFRMGQ